MSLLTRWMRLKELKHRLPVIKRTMRPGYLMVNEVARTTFSWGTDGSSGERNRDGREHIARLHSLMGREGDRCSSIGQVPR